MPRLLFVGLAALIVHGCAGSASRDADDLDSGALPFRVAVYFDERGSSLPVLSTEEEPSPYPIFRWTGRDIAASIARSLVDDHELVSDAVVIEAPSQDEARQAAQNYEYLLLLSLEAPPNFAPPERSWGWGTLEVVSWLFGGIPSWFVPTVSYPTATHLTGHFVDMNEASAGTGEEAPLDQNVFVRSTSLSLWQRCAIGENPGEYALSLVVPPMVLRPEDKIAEGEKVTAELMEELGDEFARALRPALVERELERTFRVSFLEPAPGASVSGKFPRVLVAVTSQDSVPIAKLEVRRYATDVPTFRWVASEDRIAAINDQLVAEEGGGRARFQVPVELPLVPGRNVVRVGAVRNDGTRLTRTVVYFYEES